MILGALAAVEMALESNSPACPTARAASPPSWITLSRPSNAKEEE
jgi:hypothetical protein